MRFPRYTLRLPALRRSLLALAALGALTGCGMQGDFGEVNRTLVRDDIHDWVGSRRYPRKADCAFPAFN